MKQAAEVIYRNGAIYTVDGARSWAQAVAIRGGRFVYVGSNEGVARFVGAETQVVELGGKMAMPGLHDMHIHGVEGGIKELFECTFPLGCSVEEIVGAVAEYASRNSERE